MTELLAEPEASTSAPPQSLCSLCNHKNAIYTCPRCHVRTCSLACSSAHKAKTSCSGERDKAAYVPMNKYSWGTMMDDYTFLEDVGRKVSDWGKEIVRGGFGTGSKRSDEIRGRGRGRGHRGRGGGNAGTKTKRDILKMQLEARDIDMDVLPLGMEKRMANQSSWDFKNQTAFLTIEFKFYRPPDPFTPSSTPQEQPFIYLTYRNNIKLSLISLLQTQVKERQNAKKEGGVPPWVRSLVLPDADDPEGFEAPHCLMPAPVDPTIKLANPVEKQAYYRLDPIQPLISQLRNTQFVEYPTIEVREQFQGMLVDRDGMMIQPAEAEEGRPKRRRLNAKAGRAAINGLLGDYGSDDEEPGELQKHGMSLLGDYSGSEVEDDAEGGAEIPESGILDEDDEVMSEEIEIDPQILLELMRQTRGGEVATADETADWGESDIEE